MITHAPSTIFAALIQVGGGVFVLALGDRPARLAGAALLLAVGAMLLLQDRNAWIDPAHRVLMIDAAFLAALVAITLRRPLMWLISASAFQLLAMASDAVIIFDHAASARAWLTVTIGFGWAVFACILWGGWSGTRR